jgi:hypothetical protein
LGKIATLGKSPAAPLIRHARNFVSAINMRDKGTR